MATVDHRQRFGRWRDRLPTRPRYLVGQVLARVVPEFEARGFVWYPDFAGGDPNEVAADEIPLQRRSGRDWPTVQIQFSKRARPYFNVDFAVLPPDCRRFGVEPIPQDKAVIVYAPAFFSLRKGKGRGLDGQFGYDLFALRPRHYLDSEVDKAVSLLPVLFDLFDRGIPPAWLVADFGYVAKHVMLMGSWRLMKEHRAKKGAVEK